MESPSPISGATDTSSKISHDGVVQQVSGNHVSVRIVQTSACAACGARGACHAGESKVKVVDVWTPDSALYKAGDLVRVVGSYRSGMKAVMLGFGLPLLLLVAGIMVNRLIVDEVTSVIIALAVLGVYYFVLWLMRRKVEKEFVFSIEKRST